MKTLNLTKAALLLLVPSLVTLANAAGIANSAHDWSTESWNVNKELCGPCHMAHGSDPNNQLIPLWSHETINATWMPFQSPHGTTIGQPDGPSKACLSCHDGTLAYNQLKGQVPVGQSPLYVQGDYVIGNVNGVHDLRGAHPISFLYNDAVNNSPTNSLKLPGEVLSTTLPAGNNLVGSSVQNAFLTSDGKVQCISCHDVHRQKGDSGLSSNKPINAPNHNPLLLAYGIAQDGSGSALCRSCHNK
jgi:hypothetical protein